TILFEDLAVAGQPQSRFTIFHSYADRVEPDRRLLKLLRFDWFSLHIIQPWSGQFYLPAGAWDFSFLLNTFCRFRGSFGGFQWLIYGGENSGGLFVRSM